MSQPSLSPGVDPANRLRLDYRAPASRRCRSCPIVDAHTHLHAGPQLPECIAAADVYGISQFWSMTPRDDMAAVRAALGERVQFIAIPNWRGMRKGGLSPAFREEWLADLDAFAADGARLCKFWMAPRIRGEFGLQLSDDYFRPLVERARGLGLFYMVHIADPSLWWQRADKYADVTRFGTKIEQYPQLEWLAEHVAPTPVIAAHMGGFSEDPAFLAGLLARHENLHLDMSATKWVVREVARHPRRVHDLIVSFPARFLFGSDLVASPEHRGFDHYASRYWAHQTMWESDYSGESPIEDPDADDPPQLRGVELPEPVLRAVYFENATRLAGQEAG